MPRYIDADKLTDRAYQLNFDKKISGRELAIVNRLIAELPTEDVTPVVRAHWNNHKRKEFLYDHGLDYELVDDGYECSNCNHCETWRTNYCSNCGAKMDKREKEDNA